MSARRPDTHGPARAPRGRRSNQPRAFTLLELLVTIGIIAVLAAIVLSVGNAVLKNAERNQLTMAFQALDQAILEFERAREQKITYRRLSGDPAGVYDIVELNLTAPYLMVALLNGMDIDAGANVHPFRPLLASHEPALEILKRIDPDLLRRDTSTVPAANIVPNPRLELVDPWGNRVGVVFPGRAKLAGEVGDADGTVRTSDESSLGVCRDRRICFVSPGPDANFGTREDNVSSYELIWPLPPLN